MKKKKMINKPKFPSHRKIRKIEIPRSIVVTLESDAGSYRPLYVISSLNIIIEIPVPWQSSSPCDILTQDAPYRHYRLPIDSSVISRADFEYCKREHECRQELHNFKTKPLLFLQDKYYSTCRSPR